MTYAGGIDDIGSIFKIKPDGTGYTVIHSFSEFENNSPEAYGNLTFDGTLLYGMTHSGGFDFRGSIFSIKPDGSGYTIIYDFKDSPSDFYPHGSLLLFGSSLYGMAEFGGTNLNGTIFRFTIGGGASITVEPISLVTQIGGQATIDVVPLVTTTSPLNVGSIRVVQQPTSGAVATVSNGVLHVDYTGLSFAGTDKLTIEACNLASVCTQEEVTIEVAGDVTVFNALSPNGDGKNDIFYLQAIEVIPSTKNNKVTVYDRWGSVVFETTNYNNSTNVFRGQNQSGNALPTGIYYYKLTFTDSGESRTGFISLRQ